MQNSLIQEIAQEKRDKIELLDQFISGLTILEGLLKDNNTSKALDIIRNAKDSYINSLIINNGFIVEYGVFTDAIDNK